MVHLTTPPRDLAFKLLSEVGFEDRLTGSILHPRAGVRGLSLYSLEEVFLLLKEPHPQIELAELERWIRQVLDDGELADSIRNVTLREAGDRESIPLVRDLIGWRLIQCKQVTG